MSADELVIEENATDFCGVAISFDGVMADIFNEDTRFEQLLELFESECPQAWGWFEVAFRMMEALGYVRVAKNNIGNSPNDLDCEFAYEVFAAPEIQHKDWVYRSSLNDDGYMPSMDHRPQWGAPVLDDLDRDARKTLPKLVVFVYSHRGGDCRLPDNYNPPQVGYFEGHYSVPMDLSCQWHLEPLDEDDEDACEFAETANDSGYLSAAEASSYLEQEFSLEVAEDENGDKVPFDLEKCAFRVVNEAGQEFWCYPDRHYFGQ